ncbi:MAG: multidrug efflux RND transporter permease subunit [Gemmataceae bacterium]|nr:multidrug efflux RND transporter permease subunit [Gemmataceae bacterium]
MLSRFFIDRPIFATVLSLTITLLGAVTVPFLPIAQYPEITPPTIQVSCTYPGASAQVVADSVAAPIEQEVNGIDRMVYMSSQSTNDGAYNLTVTFEVGTDVQMALVDVQNRVQIAVPQLPSVLQKQGITIKKKAPDLLLCVNLISPDGRYDDLYLSNYATIHLQDELFRLYGVGDISYLGQRSYSIRAWLDPDRLATRNLTASDVANALRQQNVQVVAGQLGEPPMGAGQEKQITMTALGRLTTPEQYGDIIVKTGSRAGADMPVVRLRDVARVELGAQSYDQTGLFDGQHSVALGIHQLPGTNALQTAKGIRSKMEQLAAAFPEGMEYRIAYDTTPFIAQSIREVLLALRDAILLVALVVFLFLQNWRAAIIPLAAIPVALAGTVAAMGALGFSLNNLSLFGLVLAIGIVVDDAIVVVENVERWLSQGLSPKEAANRAMGEVTGPVIAVALVLSAVFVPCAFLSGITGQFFRQFALTIAVSTILSAVNSLTLSPALAALLLRPQTEARRRESLPRVGFVLALTVAAGWLAPSWIGVDVPEDWTWLLRIGCGLAGALVGWVVARGINGLLGGAFGLFNRGFERVTHGYTRLVALLLRGSIVLLFVYGGLLFLTAWIYHILPTSYIPQQDKGFLVVNIQLPDSASVQRTTEVMERIDRIARATPGVQHTLGVSGQSIVYIGNSPNWGSMFIILDPFDERRTPELQGPAIAERLRQRFYREIQEGVVSVFGPPPVPGLGTAGGLKMMVEDRYNLGPAILQHETDALVAKGRHEPDIARLFSIYRANTPQLFADIDREKVRAQGVAIEDVFDTFQTYMGSVYVNNFNEFGRSWQVNIQADGQFRNRVEEVGQLKVRNNQGRMVPLSTLVDIREVGGPVMVLRYNMYPSAPVNGAARLTASSGEAIDTLEALAQRELPRTFDFEWTDLTYFQLQAERGTDFSSRLSRVIFPLSVLVVFLVLAAQYESWTMPLAVILVVPLCMLSAAAGVILSHTAVNIFTQIGLVVLVGLSSKNAVLIVQFARQTRLSGVDRRTSTLEACRLRLRPILMTSLAFVLGVVPLVLAEGAGAEMRRDLGNAVCSGMLGVTAFGLLLTPVFFFVLQWFSEPRQANSVSESRDLR